MRRTSAWNMVIEKFKSRLSEWKAKTMSYGGRLTLVKSVLGSLPLYYFSMLRVPSCVISALERIQKKLFWGGIGDGKKLAWVKWENVIASYGFGGLNIGSLSVKNKALLSKWWWRFNVDKDAMWRRVICSIYGCEGGWSVNRVGQKGVGDGLNISLWVDKWVGDVRLCERYPRLFHLKKEKGVTVGRKESWNDGIWN
ncbi:hypothetical protein Tco_1272909 [Tanacetum coccineum]